VCEPCVLGTAWATPPVPTDAANAMTAKVATVDARRAKVREVVARSAVLDIVAPWSGCGWV